MTEEPGEVSLRLHLIAFNVSDQSLSNNWLMNSQKYAHVGMAETWMRDKNSDVQGSLGGSVTLEKVQRSVRGHERVAVTVHR